MSKWSLAFVAALVACSSQASPSGSADAGTDSAADAGADAGPVTLTFTNCTLLSDPGQAPQGTMFEGIATASAECATAKLPAVWGSANADTIDVSVKRYPAKQRPAKGQLWMLSGGPGDAGSDLELIAFLFGPSLPAYDIYLPDHRGTGHSSLVTCSTDPANPQPNLSPQQAATCAARIPHLDGITVTGAARDLVALIDATRAPGQQLMVYGISYGTYWAQRYLVVTPVQPDAVVLDSTVPASGVSFAADDRQFDAKAHALLDLCKADATCAAKLAPDPLTQTTAALAAFDAKRCEPGVGPMRAFFGALVDRGSYFERMLLPASVYRLLRCNEADLAWFGAVANYLFAPALPPVVGISDATMYNIAFSELWGSDATPAQLSLAERSMIAYAGFPPYFASLAPVWPAYRHDATFGVWPTTSAAVLVMQGGLDPNTPFGELVKSHYAGANAHYVEIPLGNHSVIGSSPNHDLTGSCGMQIILSFLANPTAAPDTSCIAQMLPLDFGNPPAKWMAAVGIKDLWENP